MNFKKLTSTILAAACVGSLWAQDFQTRSVSIFKNGSAFFVKSGEVETPDGSWFLDEEKIPKGRNGTFWIFSPENQFKSIRSSARDKEETHVVNSFGEMLRVNDGKRVRLFMNGDTVVLEGKVRKLAIQPEKKDEDEQVSQLYALTTNDNRTLILSSSQINSIRRIEFLDNPNIERKTKRRVNSVTVKFKSKKERQSVNSMYLEQGLSWKPDYLVELMDDDKARLTLRATLVNSASEFKTDELNLVAGVPNFKYATQISAFLNMTGVANYHANHNAIPNEFVLTNTISNRRADLVTYSNSFNNNNDFVPNTTANNSAASAVEDMYYYTIKDVELKKDERALVDIMQVEVPLKHIYEAQIGANNATYSKFYQTQKSTIPAFHKLKLKNNSDYTWTAASALIVQNNDGKIAPVSQDELLYTSQGDHGKINLSEAPDVGITSLEQESSRKVDNKQERKGDYTYFYDLVTVQGEISISNFKKKDARVDIKRTITGNLKDSSEKWLKAQRVQAYATGNALTDVCWEVDMKAGEKKTITYSYEIYVERYRKYHN